MAHIKKQIITKWFLNGVRVKPGTPGAEKVQTESAKWYAVGVPGEHQGKRLPLARDRKTAERMLARMLIDSEHRSARLPDKELQRRPITKWIEEYGRHQASSGASPIYVQRTAAAILRVFEAASIQTVADLLRPGVRARVEAAIANFPSESRTKAGNRVRLGPKTRGYYYRDARSFCEWLRADHEVLIANPLTRSCRGRGSRLAGVELRHASTRTGRAWPTHRCGHQFADGVPWSERV